MSLRLTLFGNIDPAPRKVWLVKGLIGVGETGVMFGAPGSGKSVLVSDVAAHIAARRAWLGRAVSGGAVLFLAAERAALTKRRLAAWRIHHRVDDLPLGVADGNADLCSGEAVADVLAKAREVRDTFRQELQLIVVDTVSRTLAGGDENSPKDMGRYISHIGEIQNETGAAILLVHHIPADGTQRLRGHGALLGAADVTISVEKHATGRTATLDKANDSQERENVAFDLASVDLFRDDLTGETTTAPVVVPAIGIVHTAKKQASMTKSMQIALRALRQAVDEGGQSPPLNGGHFPSDAIVTTVDRWRDQAIKLGISTSDEPRARRLAFQRGSEALIAAQHVSVWDAYAWLAQ